MKKIFLFIMILCVYTDMFGQSIVKIVESTEKQLQLKVVTTPVILTTGIEENGIKYQNLNDVNCYKFAEGEPNLPALSYWIVIPNDAKINITVDKGNPIVIGDVVLSPVFKETVSGEGSEFILNKEIYSKNSFFPKKLVECEDIKKIRNQSCSILWIYPYRYNPIKKELEIYEDLTISVNFDSNTSRLNIVDEYTYNYLNRIAINTKDICSIKQSSKKTNLASNNEFLIICDDELKNAGEKLVLWKNMQGIKSKCISTLEINSMYNASSDSLKRIILKNYISNIPNTADSTIRYILLLGDVNTIPTNYGIYHPYNYNPACNGCQGKIATDLYYFDNDSTIDYIADFSYGRLPLKTLNEAIGFVDKLISYESVRNDESIYYNTILVAAQFQDNNQDSVEDARFTKTANDVYSYLKGNGYTVNREYFAEPNVYPKYWSNSYVFENDTAGIEIPYNLQIPNFQWTADEETISNKINNGAFLVFHRDHGTINGWSRPYFRNTHVNALQNGSKFPVVFSINCETGWFDTESDEFSYSSGDCFAEEFIRKSNGGAIGIFAATRASYSRFNDRLAWGLMDAIWPDFIEYHHGSFGNSFSYYRMGDVLNYATSYLASKYSTTNTYKKITQELFHYLGDPTMEIWTALPQDFSNVVISETSNGLTVNTGVPDCTVCVYSLLDNGSSYYEVQEGQHLSFSEIPKPYMLSIKKHNYIPYFFTQDVYIQNYTFEESAMIVGRNIYVGENVTTAETQGPVIINNGVNVYFKPTENIFFNSGFNVSLGGTFEVMKN